MSESILIRISNAKTESQRKGEDPKYVVLSKDDYDELWEASIRCISVISVRMGRSLAKERPEFEKLVCGLIPQICLTPMSKPYAHE